MNPDPLAELRDIHLPVAVSWWPPAVGWWLLLLLIVLLVVVVIWWKHRRGVMKNKQAIYSRREIIDAALLELSLLEKAMKAGANVITVAAGLSRLLRRAAIRLSMDQSDFQVAGITGEAWLRWLDQQWHKDAFCKGAGRQMIQTPYLSQSEIEIGVVSRVCRDWLEAQR
jgi:hypothetical protein